MADFTQEGIYGHSFTNGCTEQLLGTGIPASAGDTQKIRHASDFYKDWENIQAEVKILAFRYILGDHPNGMALLASLTFLDARDKNKQIAAHRPTCLLHQVSSKA